MAKKTTERDEVKCPLCEMLDALSARCDKLRSSHFAQHLRNARKEMLLAVRSVIDERIEDLEKEKKTTKSSRSKRIEVKGGD